MNTKTTLLSVSFLALMAMAAPAHADTNVLCSVRASAHGADYKPGVDVNGHAVPPADVAGSPKPPMGQAVTIPLSIDLAQRMNEVLPAGSKLEAQQGLIEVQPDGRVMINGKDMTAPADTMCSTVSKQREAALKTEDAPKNVVKKPVHHKKKTALKPTETAVSEPMAPETPKAETTPTTPPESVVSPPQTTVPQVLDAPPPAVPAAPGAPSVPQPAPMAPPAAPSPTATPGSSGTPTPPPSGAAVQPSDSGTLAPRGSLDPLTPPQQPTPTPGSSSSSSSGSSSGGTLSGGAH